MLPRHKRLTTELFPVVIKSGALMQGKFFSLRVAKSDDHDRFSVVISKKIDKRAVGRNLLKRRALAELRSALNFSKKSHGRISRQPALCVFFAKKGAEAVSAAEISADMAKLLKMAGIL